MASSGIALPALAALVIGPVPFAVALTLIAVLALVDLSGVLTRAAARPVLPAALIPAVGLPVAVAFQPDLDWDLVPPFVAAGFLVAFLFALMFGRRRGIVEGAGTTMLAGLVVGLGTASLVLLRNLPHGFRWVLALLVVVTASDVAGPLWERFGPSRREHGGDHSVLASVLLVTLATAALLLFLRPPLQLAVALLLALAGLTATLGGEDLRRGLMAEADDSALAPPEPGRLGSGLLLGLVDGLLLGAPVVYVLARSAAL